MGLLSTCVIYFGSPVGRAMAGNCVLLGRLGACPLTVGAIECEGEGCASSTWLVYSKSPVANAMAGNGVLLGMLRTCLLTVVAADCEGAPHAPQLQAPLCEPPCNRPTISMGVRSYNRNVTFCESSGGRPRVTDASSHNHHSSRTKMEQQSALAP